MMTIAIIVSASVGAFLGFMLCAVLTSGKVSDLEKRTHDRRG